MTQGKRRPICFWCKHFNEEKKYIYPYEALCTAFPEGIPIEIWGDEYGASFDHNIPYPGDGGTLFEKADQEIISKRQFAQTYSSQEILEESFEYSLFVVQHNHRMRLNPPEQPRELNIIPLDLPRAEQLRNRFKEWNLDLHDQSNRQTISSRTYRAIHDDIDTYIQWLERYFSRVKSREEAISVFAKVINLLANDEYHISDKDDFPDKQ